VTSASSSAARRGWPESIITRRVRVISDNDYSGDPDGLVQLAQHLLSPSVDLRCVIGSHLRDGDPFDSSGVTADKAALAAAAVARLCRRNDVSIIAGSNHPLADRHTPIASAAAHAIVAEAMRDDTDLPLFVTCGASLTEIASAWLIEPRIEQRLTIVWIGGHEHDGLAEPPPGAPEMEYNLHLDHIAGQVVFNDSNLPLWQVPRNMYRSVIATRAEMLVRMQPHGELGAYLFDKLANVVASVELSGRPMGETYVLGDSPLVLLTALMTAFEPSPASSFFATIPCPRILESGRYEARLDGRPLRVYTMLDNRTLLEDLYAKLELHAMSTS
jgi:purine nucleosidase